MPEPYSEDIIPRLQASLKLHLSQWEAYEGQANHFERWGYPKLAKDWFAYAKEERGHARKIIARLEFYDIAPDFAHDTVAWPRHDFEGVLDSNYEGDQRASQAERDGYMTCSEAGDANGARLFQELLKGSEDSMAGIEAIRREIEQIGLDNYLANKV
jgi:bacterioferritin